MPKQSRTVRQIQPREFSRGRRTIFLLYGEKAGMREMEPLLSTNLPNPVSNVHANSFNIIYGKLTAVHNYVS